MHVYAYDMVLLLLFLPCVSAFIPGVTRPAAKRAVHHAAHVPEPGTPESTGYQAPAVQVPTRLPGVWLRNNKFQQKQYKFEKAVQVSQEFVPSEQASDVPAVSVPKFASEFLKANDLRAAFDKMDEDGNGVLSREELQATIKMLDVNSNSTVTDEELGELFDLVDRDKNGSIDFDEFHLVASQLIMHTYDMVLPQDVPSEQASDVPAF